MSKLATACLVSLMALVSVGCSASDGSVKDKRHQKLPLSRSCRTRFRTLGNNAR